jgi:hypothetical protein
MIKKNNLYWCNLPPKETRYIEFIYEYLSFSGKDIAKYLKNYSTTFIPAYLFGEDSFTKEHFKEVEDMDFRFKSLSVYDTNGSCFNITPISQNQLNPPKFYTHLRFIEKVAPLTNEEFMFLSSLPGFKIATESNYEYYLMQSEQSPYIYKAKGINYNPSDLISIDGLLSEFIDISKNSGRERFLPGMKFIPAFKIWFGNSALELFSKEKLLSFPQAVQLSELPNSVIEMQLMDNINLMSEPYNVAKQIEILKYLGIEDLEVSKY